MSSLLSMLYDLQVEVKDTNNEAEKQICCPFCPGRVDRIDDMFKLGFNVENGFGHCYRCDWAIGRQFTSDSQRRKALFDAFREALGGGVEYSYDDGGEVAEEQTKQKVSGIERIELPDEYEPLWKGRQDKVLRKGYDYLRDRGVTREQIKRFRIGFCCVGKYAHRVMLPVIYGRITVGFVARTIWKDVDLRYLNSEGNKALFNFPSPRDRRDNCLLVEGPFDVLACDRAELEMSSVGMLGSALTDFQGSCLRKFQTVTMWVDMDKAGLKAIKSVREALEGTNINLKLVVPKDKRDPGSLKEREIRTTLKECVRPYSENTMMRLRYKTVFA